LSAAAVLTLASFVLVSCRPLPPGALPASPLPDREVKKVALLGPTRGTNAGPAQGALEGTRLALDLANQEADMPIALAAFTMNTGTDPMEARAIVAQQVLEDPDVVAVVMWPSTGEAGVVRDMLEEAKMPVLDLSPALSVNPDVDADVSLRLSFTPDDAQQARTLAEVIIDLGIQRACAAGDGDVRGESIKLLTIARLHAKHVKTTTITPVLPGEAIYDALATEVVDADCDVLLWTGGGTDGAVVRASLDAAGAQDVRMVGADVLRNEAFLSNTLDAGAGTIAVCPCVDVSTSSDVDVQAFIQEYQAKYGGSPAAYAAEGWDAGTLLVEAVEQGAVDRAELAAALQETTAFSGVVTDYRFEKTTGMREVDEGDVFISEARAGRWVPVDAVAGLGPAS